MGANEAEECLHVEGSGPSVIELCRGTFTATVEPCKERYAFAIRDRERERPVIHGYGMDRRSAIHAAEDLLETLAA
jgi:hypothetical protein